jgi:hypothetical protein
LRLLAPFIPPLNVMSADIPSTLNKASYKAAKLCATVSTN